MITGRIILDSIESVCLKGNPLNDPYQRNLVIYLPPGYDSSNHKYPVLFFLPGFTGKGLTLLNREAFTEGLDERLNRLIHEGTIKPMIVVMPDCFTYYGGSQYLNSDATGQYETYIVNELVPYIKNNFKVSNDRLQWAIAGKSSGGYGAITLGMRHPNIFSIIACHSGDMAFEYCYLPDFPQSMIEIEKHGGVAEFMNYFYSQAKKTSSSLVALNTIAMSAAYSPNKKILPHHIDLPFDLKTGAIRDEIWEKWLSYDPVRSIEEYGKSISDLKIFIDCGIRDEFRLFAGSRILSSKLKRLQIDHVYEEFDDTHMKVSYRYDRSLQFISQSVFDGYSG